MCIIKQGIFLRITVYSLSTLKFLLQKFPTMQYTLSMLVYHVAHISCRLANCVVVALRCLPFPKQENTHTRNPEGAAYKESSQSCTNCNAHASICIHITHKQPIRTEITKSQASAEGTCSWWLGIMDGCKRLDDMSQLSRKTNWDLGSQTRSQSYTMCSTISYIPLWVTSIE